MSKKLNFVAAILDWQLGIFNPVFYPWYRSFVPILVILRSIFNRGDNLKEKQAYKKSGQSNNFWVSYGPLKYVYIRSNMGFSGITPKNLTFEYNAKNKTYSVVNYTCVYQNWLRNGRHKSKMAATKFKGFLHFNIRPRWFPAHHLDRLVLFVVVICCCLLLFAVLCFCFL